MSRLLLIKTPQNHYARYFTAPSPPLGLLYLAAYARRERDGRDLFMLIDERTHETSDDEYRHLVREFRPDVVALSVLSTEADRLADIVPLFGRIAPTAKILIGGPHATAEGPGIIEDFPETYVERVEAENSYVKLLNGFDEGLAHPGQGDERISGLMYTRPDGTVSETPYGTDDPDVQSLPMPAWDLVDFDVYEKHNRMTPLGPTRYAPLFTSRGCPYRCTYCHDVFGKGFRAQSASRVVDEIEHLIDRYGVSEFEVFDDIFNADYARTMAICDEIKRRNLETKFCFPNGIRGDRMERPLLQALADVGTYHMAFAVESASPRVQKLIRKHIKLDKIAENITTAGDVGIFTWGFFMLGFPTERREELQATVDFAVNSDLHGAFFFSVIPFGGTELQREYAAPDMSSAYASPLFLEGTAAEADYHYAENEMSDVTPDDLKQIQWTAYRRFYFHPRRWWRGFRDFPWGKRSAIKKGVGFSKYLVFDRDYRGSVRESVFGLAS